MPTSRFRITPRVIAIVVALLGVMLPFQPIAAAQPNVEDMLLRLDGLETAYARRYNSVEYLGFGTPEVVMPGTPDRLVVTVLQFGDTSQVSEAYDGMMNGFVARLILGEPDADLDETRIDGLGDQAIMYAGETDDEDSSHVALLAVQDGNLGILIQAEGADAAIQQTMEDFAAFMVEAEPGDSEIVVGDHGEPATGGTFDIMPAREDEDVLHGLIPMYDYDLLQGDEPLDHLATPAA